MFKVPRDRKVNADDLLLYSLEIAGPEGYWVEFSRAAHPREDQRPHEENG